MRLKVLLLCGISWLAGHGQVDLVAVHGKVWTEDPKHPEVEAFAVSGHRILAIGTDAEVMKLAGAATRVIDLKGRRVVPGLNDSHVHFF